MEIVPGIHRIKCKFGSNRMVYVHLLIGSQASMLVDTGCAQNPEQDILPYMKSIGFDPQNLTYILISHSDLDHQGGNQAMKKAAPRAIFACHNLDRAWIEDTEALIKGRYSQFEADHNIGYGDAGKAGIRKDCLSTPIDLTLEGGESFRLSADWVVQAVHTPGHTWGHLAVYDPRGKAMIGGEAALWNAILADDWQPAMPPTYCYVDTYLATQAHLLTMDIQTYLPAHWEVRTGQGVKEFFSESRNYCLLVEQKLIEFARSGEPFTLRQAIDKLAPQLGSWGEATNQEFSYGMLGNLDRLTRRGILEDDRNKDRLMIWNLA